MRRSALLSVVVGAALLAALPVSGVEAANSHANYRAVCPNPPAGYAHCHVLVVTDSHGNPLASSSPTGLSPSTIKSVYGFPTGLTAGAGQTIAIVDAYDDPTAESDLNTFSQQFGLPDCTTSNGCFTKVDQTGGSNYPHANSGWALEISLDIEWAHAIAPGAKILLVEAKSSSMTNLLAAEDTAASSGAPYVSNSWGGSESSGETSYDSNFVHPGVSFFASAGDSGLPAEYPSASPNVISVGGTTLTQDSSTGKWSETGWSSGGGGCSAYETATSAQYPASKSLCGTSRATPDVALDANPSSGVSVYDSTKYMGQQGWFTVGGTSVSSPIWAAASADKGATVDSGYVYGSSINFNDVTVGNNGAPCLVGYDLCTGLGSWIYSSSSLLVPSGGGSSTGTPTASFTDSCSGLTCQFTDTSTDTGGTITGWSWDFGNGSTSTVQDPSYTYSSAGTYTVTLTVTDSNGSTDTTSSSVNVSSQSGTQSMNVAVNAGTISTKGPNYWVPLTVTATDSSSGAGVSGASVQLDVYQGTTCNGSPAATGSATTDSSGSASFNFHTKASGSWCAEATVTASGYSTNTGQTTFTTP